MNVQPVSPDAERCSPESGRPVSNRQRPAWPAVPGAAGVAPWTSSSAASRSAWIEVVALRFPSGRVAEEVVPRDAAALAWMATLGCLELHPHPVRAEDLEHPDELRIDLDPVPGVEWPQIQAVARVVRG